MSAVRCQSLAPRLRSCEDDRCSRLDLQTGPSWALRRGHQGVRRGRPDLQLGPRRPEDLAGGDDLRQHLQAQGSAGKLQQRRGVSHGAHMLPTVSCAPKVGMKQDSKEVVRRAIGKSGRQAGAAGVHGGRRPAEHCRAAAVGGMPGRQRCPETWPGAPRGCHPGDGLDLPKHRMDDVHCAAQRPGRRARGQENLPPGLVHGRLARKSFSVRVMGFESMACQASALSLTQAIRCQAIPSPDIPGHWHPCIAAQLAP
jgi:hypothetical protein